MAIARTILKWCDKKFDEALYEEDDRKGDAKALLSGGVEGYVDAAVMLYIPVTIVAYVWMHKANKK